MAPGATGGVMVADKVALVLPHAFEAVTPMVPPLLPAVARILVDALLPVHPPGSDQV